MRIKSKLLLSIVLVCGVPITPAQAPPLAGPHRSAREVVELVWKRATEGELLKPDGWQRASAFFLQPSPFPKDGTIRVVSNYWGVEHGLSDAKKATITLEYEDAGRIDSELRYKPPAKTTSFKSAMIITLALAPTYSIMYKADGKTIEKKTPSSEEWQITNPQGQPWTTVNTAIRYVLEAREKTSNPTIKKNADLTLAKLLQWQ